MKKISKVIILITCTLSILSFLTPRVICNTTIGDSTIPVEIGDFYKWKMTYCHQNFSSVYGIGSYWNLTIDSIAQGFYGPLADDALIVNATLGEYSKNSGIQGSIFVPNFLVYNATLYYLSMYSILFVPIPLNLTMVAEAWGEPFYTIDGNVLTINPGSGNEVIYKFNSNGLMTNYIMYYESEKLIEYSLSGEKETIPFGNYYILVSIFAIIYLCVIIKKQNPIIEK